MIKFLFIIFCIGLFSCSSAGTGKDSVRENNLPAGDKILYIVINAARTGNNDIDFSLSKSSLAEGRLKVKPDSSLIPGFLAVNLISEDHNVISRIVTENPLEKNIEYVDEQGNFKRTIVKSDKDQIFLRTPYDPNIRFVQVDSIDGSSNLIKKALFELTINR